MMPRYSFVKTLPILLIFIVIFVPAASASAALRICRTDPLVYFADGHKLSITATVSADASAITQITYTIHAPAGAEVTKVVHTAGGLGILEVVDVQTDGTPGVFTVDTVVTTQMKDVDVKAGTMLMVGVSSTASGHSFDHLITTVKDPVMKKGTSVFPVFR